MKRKKSTSSNSIENNNNNNIVMETSENETNTKVVLGPTNHSTSNIHTENNVMDRVADDDNVLIEPLNQYGITKKELDIAIKVLSAVGKLNPHHPSNRPAKNKPNKKNNRKKKNNNKKQKTNNMDDNTTTDNEVTTKNDNVNDNDSSQKEEHERLLGLYKDASLRLLRKELVHCCELQNMCMYNGLSQDEYYEKRHQERTLKRQKASEAHFQKIYIQETQLRKGRLQKMQALLNSHNPSNNHKALPLIPDGHVDTAATTLPTPLLTDKTDNDAMRDVVEGKSDGISLPKLRSCYVCKVRYRDLHFFYDQLCPTCASLNYDKRLLKIDMKGKVAIVTGSRVKIGYQTCLKLLRCGCTVIATTRFPNMAAHTYQKEHDFNQWKDQLSIFGLDLRDVTGIELFCRYLSQKYKLTGGIDILINNACQTIRRPVQYYIPTVEKEQTIWKSSNHTHKSLLGNFIELEKIRSQLQKSTTTTTTPSLSNTAATPDNISTNDENQNISLLPSLSTPVTTTDKEADDRKEDAIMEVSDNTTSITSTSKNVFEKTGLSYSAAMSQMMVLPEDMGVRDNKILPPGSTDINGQQIDLRTTNSWLYKIHQVSTPEMMECMLINTIAPFVLNSKLLPLMTTPSSEDRPDRYIINVSAMEGKFYRYKMPNHPHTNMAKAALNMMTRTSAEDLAKQHRIYMNSVDTGWINDENPLHKASKIAQTNNFQTPIDEIDAASRILDPIFSGISQDSQRSQQQQQQKNCTDKNDTKQQQNTKPYGKFFKDYRETEW